MAPHIQPQKIADFRHEIRRYYKKHERDFPWRRTRDPYGILISEFMLQQTQVSRVMQKYKPFLKRFPDFRILAHVPLRAVLQGWQGLGYNHGGKDATPYPVDHETYDFTIQTMKRYVNRMQISLLEKQKIAARLDTQGARRVS